MDDLDNELLERLLEGHEAQSEGDKAESIRRARELLMARRIVQRMKSQNAPKPAWWQNEWFIRVLLAVLALIGGWLGLPKP